MNILYEVQSHSTYQITLLLLAFHSILQLFDVDNIFLFILDHILFSIVNIDRITKVLKYLYLNKYYNLLKMDTQLKSIIIISFVQGSNYILLEENIIFIINCYLLIKLMLNHSFHLISI